MTTRNDITGNRIRTGANSEAYRTNKFWDNRNPAPVSYDEPITSKDIDAQVKSLTNYLKSATKKPG